MTAESLRTVPGGKGANQAVAAARQGAPVTFVGRVGDDEHGRVLRAGLEAEGIDIRALRTSKRSPTGLAVILVDRDGANLISVLPGANARVRTGDVPAAALRRGIVLLQLEIPIATVAGIVKVAAGRCRIILDPAPAMRLPDRLLQGVDLLTPNDHEACVLTGERDPLRAAERLLIRGARAVVVKLGSRGALLAGPDGVTAISPFRVRAVDETAAGDTFNGALAARLARGDRLLAALRYASAAAALSVTRAGAQPSIPKAREVARFLDQHR